MCVTSTFLAADTQLSTVGLLWGTLTPSQPDPAQSGTPALQACYWSELAAQAESSVSLHCSWKGAGLFLPPWAEEQMSCRRESKIAQIHLPEEKYEIVISLRQPNLTQLLSNSRTPAGASVHAEVPNTPKSPCPNAAGASSQMAPSW